MREKTLYIMVGVPGSGKTWFAKQRLIIGSGWFYISRDEIRFSILQPGEKHYSHEKEVFTEFIKRLVKGLKNPDIYYVIADATHLNWNSRHKLMHYLELAGIRLNEINIIPIVIQSNIIDITERNSSRAEGEIVPASEINGMLQRMTDPKEDNFNYTAIMYVNNAKHHYVEKE